MLATLSKVSVANIRAKCPLICLCFDIVLFLVSLFETLLLVRIGAHKLHDRATYDRFNPRNSKARTFTGWLRRKTGLDWHHIHVGFIILVLILPWILIEGLNIINIILLGVSLSMIADQITPLIDRKSNYFSNKKLLISIIFHIIIALIAIMIF